jgi:polyphosphate kinase
MPRAKITLPKRQKRGDYREPDYAFKFVPEKF